MSGKTLSTGTLSLRFMQNAHRAKQLKEVEADRAQVKDDGEWEVAKEVREAWGIASSSESAQTVTHETSYLPFLFPSLPDASESSSKSSSDLSKPKGRRAFDKKGQEVAAVEEKSLQPPVEGATGTSKKPRVHPRPVSISGSSGNLHGFSQLKPPKDLRTAKEAIYDNSGVGVDMKSAPAMQPIPVAEPSPKVFLKPFGVDDPPDMKPPTSGGAQSDPGIIHGARSKVKVKRERDLTNDQEGKGRKKKKKTIE